MPEDTKKYVDSEALNIFLGKLKDKYATNSASSFYVNYAGTAGVANQLSNSLVIKDNEGTVLGTFNGSEPVEVTVGTGSGSGSVPAGVIVLKHIIGTQDNPTLPVGYLPAKGDVIICVNDVTETQGGDTVVLFKGDSEYIFDGSKWVELGSVTNLGDYAKKSEVYTKQQSDDKYLTSSDLSGYATTSELNTAITNLHVEDFETKANASSTYETKTNASNTYLSKSDASDIYLAKSDVVTETDINGLFPEEEPQPEPEPEPEP